MATKNNSTALTYNDPRYVDGDCYEVAQFAVNQIAVFADFLSQRLKDAEPLILNAAMQRAMDQKLSPEVVAKEWDESPLKRRLEKSIAELSSPNLQVLAQAAGWNPKAPLDG